MSPGPAGGIHLLDGQIQSLQPPNIFSTLFYIIILNISDISSSFASLVKS